MTVAPAAAPATVAALLRGWHRAECWIAVACFAFIAAVLVIDVVGREFYGPLLRLLGLPVGATGLFGSQKLAVFALVIGGFAGIGIATATGSHLLPRLGFGWVEIVTDHARRCVDQTEGLGAKFSRTDCLGGEYCALRNSGESSRPTPTLGRGQPKKIIGGRPPANRGLPVCWARRSTE